MTDLFSSKRAFVNLLNPRPAIRAAVEAVEPRRLFADFTVTTTADSGPGSLREAIDLANADQTADNILFNIPGSGVQRIAPLTPLPKIASPVNIDGYSQPGTSQNTLASGNNAKLLIEINGDSLPTLTASAGLWFDNYSINYVPFSSAGSSLRGLVISGQFSEGAVHLEGDNGIYDITITGNFLGTDPTGEIENEEIRYGIYAMDAAALKIGGLAAGDRNVLGGDHGAIELHGSDNNLIVNNYINVSASGTKRFGTFGGLQLDGSSYNTIGGTTPAARNLIGVSNDGISLGDGSRQNRVIGNFVGVATDGATPLVGRKVTGGNGYGISIFGDVPGSDVVNSPQNFIGGPTAAEGNVIANVDRGVYVVQSQNSLNLIRHNSIFNTIYAIYLTADGAGNGDMNDTGDADSGANGLQNFATIINAIADASGTHVQAVLNSTPNRPFVVDFFASPNDGNPLRGQAKTWLGAVTATTDPYGNVTFAADLPAVPAGTYLTNTVTTLVNAPYGSTSQVSAAAEAVGVVSPPPPVLPGLSVANVSTTEGNNGTKTLTFTVKLSAASASTVKVNYKTTDGTAKTGDNDYLAAAGTLTFTPGQTSKTVSITVKGDTKIEGNESFNLLLSGATGATISDGAAVGSIVNDDAAPVLPKLSVGGYTAKEGQSGTTAFTFKVTLDKSSTSPITVKYATANDTAAGGSDYTAASGTLTFAAGQTSKTVTIYVKGDKVKEAEEKFFLLLSAPTNATIAVGTGTGRIQNDD